MNTKTAYPKSESRIAHTNIGVVNCGIVFFEPKKFKFYAAEIMFGLEEPKLSLMEWVWGEGY